MRFLKVGGTAIAAVLLALSATPALAQVQGQAQAGLFCSRIDGGPLLYNQADTLLPDLVVCRSEYAEAVLEITTNGG